MKYILSLILLCAVAVSAMAQKPDFVRTPNGPNTIVDYNLKTRTLILPHDPAVLSLRGGQDSTGHVMVLSSDLSFNYYIRGIGWIKIKSAAPAGSTVSLVTAPTLTTDPGTNGQVAMDAAYFYWYAAGGWHQSRTSDGNKNSNWPSRTVTPGGHELILDDNGTQWWYRHIVNGSQIQDAATLTTDILGNRLFTVTATGAQIP